MKKKIFLGILFALFSMNFVVRAVRAVDDCKDKHISYETINFLDADNKVYRDTGYVGSKIRVWGLSPTDGYWLKNLDFDDGAKITNTGDYKPDASGQISFEVTDSAWFYDYKDKSEGSCADRSVFLYKGSVDNGTRYCKLFSYETCIKGKGLECQTILTWQIDPVDGQKKSGCFDQRDIYYQIVKSTDGAGTNYNGNVDIKLDGEGADGIDDSHPYIGDGQTPELLLGKPTKAGDFIISVDPPDDAAAPKSCKRVATVRESCSSEDRGPVGARDVGGNEAGEFEYSYKLCDQITDASQRSLCLCCMHTGKSDNSCQFNTYEDAGFNDVPAGMWTAIGCVSTEPTALVQTVITIGLSLAGGVAVLMILAAGFIFTISQGDTKRTQEAKDLLTSAIVGLFFIIFSITILQFIGVKILQIPGFGTP